ncbi:MAG: glycosyltransferase family 4 protein [Chitinispirillaceae bacterium]|nr:glycosyltransferase family 4 protein [Chitinispirillaceae bacterium]
MKNKRVLFLTLFPEIGASSRYRVYQFLPHLERLGYTFRVSPLVPESQYSDLSRVKKRFFLFTIVLTLYSAVRGQVKRIRDILSAGRYDIVFIQKDILIPGLELLLKRINPHIVFDFDDALYARNPAVGPVHRWASYQRKRLLDRMLKVSSTVLVENEYNRSYARAFCTDVRILTGPIDTDRFTPHVGRGPSKRVVIGWIGAPTTAPNITPIEPILIRIGAEFPAVRFIFVGCGSHPFSPSLSVERRTWSLATEVSDLGEFDIGIMPIEDHEWARGKGGTKLLQYMAMGLACVASPVGINSEIVIHGSTGYHATSHEEWYRALSDLVRQPIVRKEMGLKGRMRAEERYSLRSAVRFWDALFRELLNPVVNV